MTIRALRILPPMAIARLGYAPEPVGNYTLDDNPEQPLEFRELKLQPTFVVDPAVLGGLVVRVDDTVYDQSVATSLVRLGGQLKQRSIRAIQNREFKWEI